MQKITEITGTGLTGLVGSRVFDLLKSKYKFSNLDLTTGVDITREKDVKNAIEKASGEALLHFAAFTDVDRAFKQRDEKEGSCYKINVLGTQYVAQYSAKTGKYLIHISTDFVFDGKKKTAYTEEDSPNPIEWYGFTKYLAEKEVEKVGGKYIIIRIAFPFRAYFVDKPDIVRSILSKLESGRLPPMFSDQIITPTFIDDIAKVIDILIQNKPQGIYHLVGSTSLSPYQLAKKIAKKYGFDQQSVKKGSLTKYLLTANRPYQKNLAISNSKIEKTLGLKISTIDEALSEIIRQRKT